MFERFLFQVFRRILSQLYLIDATISYSVFFCWTCPELLSISPWHSSFYSFPSFIMLFRWIRFPPLIHIRPTYKTVYPFHIRVFEIQQRYHRVPLENILSVHRDRLVSLVVFVSESEELGVTWARAELLEKNAVVQCTVTNRHHSLLRNFVALWLHIELHFDYL